MQVKLCEILALADETFIDNMQVDEWGFPEPAEAKVVTIDDQTYTFNVDQMVELNDEGEAVVLVDGDEPVDFKFQATCPVTPRMLIEASVPEQVYEITLAGFDGGTDATDHKVIWVQARKDQIKALQALAQGAGATLDPEGFEVEAAACEIDFHYPQDVEQIYARLEEAKS